MKNQISGEIKELNRTQFLDLFDESIHGQIKRQIATYPDCDALVCFENLDMCSSRFGDRTCMVVGPSNTTKLADLETRRLGDLPSNFQYPVAIWRVKQNDPAVREIDAPEMASTIKS